MKSGFIIVDKIFNSKNEAESYISEYKNDYEVISVNEYPSIGDSSSRNKFLVFDKIYTPEDVEDVLLSMNTNTKAHYISKSKSDKITYKYNSKNKKINKKTEFNNKSKLYQPVKITNIVMFFIFLFYEFIERDAAGQETSTAWLPVYITFYISRYFIRKVYSRNPYFKFKILISIGIYLSVFIIKTLLISNILNLAM